MSSSNSLRRFLAVPLTAFDSVRMGLQNHPKPANYAFMWLSFVVIMLVGNGADKMTTRGGLKD